MAKKYMFIFTLFLAVFLAIAMPVSSKKGYDITKDRGPTPAPEIIEANDWRPAIQPSPTALGIAPPVMQGEIFTGIDPIIAELNRVLGIPIEELEKLSRQEIDEIVIRNADTLGVIVYGEEYYDKEKGIFTSDIIAGSRIFKPESFNKDNPVPSPTPTMTSPIPTPGAYPAPQSNTATENTVAVFDSETESLLTIYKSYLPLVVKPDPLSSEISTAQYEAKNYVDKLYQDNASNGFIKEYPAIPLSIKNTEFPSDYRSKRFLGHYYQTTSHPVGKVLASSYYGYDFEVAKTTFEEYYSWGYGEPNITVVTTWTDDQNTNYYIIKDSWTGDSMGYEDLYFGDLKIYNDVWGEPDGQEYWINAGIKVNRPANRFTIRHATKLGTYFYDYYTDPYKVQQLNYTVNQYGFNAVPDLYAPLFEKGTTAADNYMFTYDAYHDCDLVNNGMDSTIQFGYLPHRYGYESKVCISRLAYINLSKIDYLATGLQALHILNKYGDPDHQYPDPRQYGNTTPRLIARWLETKWNGYGIPAYLKDPQYASGLRTNVFVALESKLGYQYNDATSRNYADMGIEVLLDTQVGNGSDTLLPGEVNTSEQLLFRPNQAGGQLLYWFEPGEAKDSGYTFALAPKTFLSDVIDMFSMPNETLGVLVSNAETTMTYWAALRMYNDKRW